MKILRVYIVFIFLFSCGTDEKPVQANAGANQSALPGDTVYLTGEGSSEFDQTLTYHWSHKETYPLVLSGQNTKQAHFIVPFGSAYDNMIFTLTVTDEEGRQDKDAVRISITPPAEQANFIADKKNKRLFFPVGSEPSQSKTLVFSHKLIANFNAQITHWNGNKLQSITIESANPGDIHTATLLYTDDNELIEEDWDVLVTNIPIMTISTTEKILDSPKKQAIINVLSHTGLLSSNSGIEIKGNTSQAYPKKSYDIEFWKPDYKNESSAEEQDMEFFGMRKDDDWILDAMFIDFSRMRNRVANELWMDIARKPNWSKSGDRNKSQLGIQGHYVELLVNNEYRGLYMLTEQLDKKQLKIKSSKREHPSGLLYKTDLWGHTDSGLASTFEADLQDYDNSSFEWLGWQLKYPKDERAIDWAPLHNLYATVKVEDDNIFNEQIQQLMSLENLIDYLLFLNLIGGDDNRGKNTYLFAYDITSDKQDDAKLFYTPWDMDGTWGRNWHSGEQPSNRWLTNTLLTRLQITNPDNFNAKLKQRWSELRNSQVTTNSIMQKFQHYHLHATQSAAIEREIERWGEQLYDLQTHQLNLTSELEYIENWITDRLQWMDTYIDEEFTIQ